MTKVERLLLYFLLGDWFGEAFKVLQHMYF